MTRRFQCLMRISGLPETQELMLTFEGTPGKPQFFRAFWQALDPDFQGRILLISIMEVTSPAPPALIWLRRAPDEILAGVFRV